MQDLEVTYEYYDHYGLQIPLVLLTVSQPVAMTEERPWYALVHQCAGHGCSQRQVYGSPVTPNGHLAMGLTQLATRWEWSDCGLGGSPTLEEAKRYQSELQALGLDCNYSYHKLAEGFYPIDLTATALAGVIDHLPDPLDDLVAWEHPKDTREGKTERIFSPHFGLVMLGPNCD